jgi:2-keto-4-pentenoate hydratase/2-oxohepta-3-ene-1,7-dioic acid hydratase in catechol pathway
MKLICIGRNYSEHIAELKNEIPENMIIFMKPSTALHPVNDPWYIPDFSEDIHYECEIVLKICKNGKHIQPQFASSYFSEVTLGIDFTARDLQTNLKSKGLPWERAKAFDHSAVLGKFIPKDSLDLTNIQFRMTQNGADVQNGNSNQMLYSFDQILVEISKFITLQTGDLIYTGTPAGVAAIKRGDHYEGWLESESVFQLDIK